MRFKLHIQCGLCGCGFDLCPVHFKDRAEFACPNCGQKLSDGVSARLRDGLTAFAQIPNNLKDGGEFSFSVGAFQTDAFTDAARRMEEDERLNASPPA